MAHWFSISRDSSWEIIVESRSWSRTTFSGPAGRGSNLLKRDDDRSSSPKWRVTSESCSLEVADFATSERMDSDGMNKDSCIISLSGFGSGKCYTIVFSKQDVVVAEAAFLSISSRLPWCTRSFSNGEPRRRSKSRISKIWKSKWPRFCMIGTALATPPTFKDVSRRTTY